ncbi:MAG: hypothetical protein JWQ38_1601 [Flavipsychrobacter sp.]|nr:hypothetical protein [Flavipsychrobacter sp.]
MKKICFILLLCAGFTYASAQEVYTSSGKAGYHKKTKREKGYDPSKLVVGGGLNGYYSTGNALAGISPMVGYNFFHNFTAGVGLGYLYYQYYVFTLGSKDYSVKERIIYPNLWARYIVWRGLYVTGTLEHDFIKYTAPANDPNNPSNVIYQKENLTADCLLLGAGIKQPLGGRVSFFVELSHDFLNSTYSPYANQPLIIHAGVCAGF